MNADLDWALDTYSRLAGTEPDETEDMIFTIMPGDPWSKFRPRHTRNGHTYDDPRNRDAEARTAAHLRRALKGRGPLEGNAMLACLFYRSNFQRVDADNLLKHVGDSANGVLWHDDSQVTLILGEMGLDPDNPRTVIVAGAHASSLLRGRNAMTECPVCGTLFRSDRGRKSCSRECGGRMRRKIPDLKVCLQCGKEFRPISTYHVLCSPECRTESIRGRNRARAGQPYSECRECGKQLAHRRGGRCRDCWRAEPKKRYDDEPTITITPLGEQS